LNSALAGGTFGGVKVLQLGLKAIDTNELQDISFDYVQVQFIAERRENRFLPLLPWLNKRKWRHCGVQRLHRLFFFSFSFFKTGHT